MDVFPARGARFFPNGAVPGIDLPRTCQAEVVDLEPPKRSQFE
jgi:hypothetical protein